MIMNRMNSVSFFPVVILIQFLHTNMYGESIKTDRAAEPKNSIIITEEEHSYALGRSLEIFEDKEKIVSIKEISAAPFQNKFKKSDRESPSFGFSSSTFWVKFTIRSFLKKDDELLLELDYPLMDKIVLYLPQSDGGYQMKSAGYILPFSKREIKHRNFVFKIPVTPGEVNTCFIKFENEDRMEMPMTLWKTGAFYEKDRTEQYVLGLFYGILLVMILYNLLLFIAVKDKSFLYYVFYILAIGFLQLTQNGLAYEYFVPAGLEKFSHYIPLTQALVLIAALQFTRSYLNTRVNAPKMNRTMIALKIIFLFFIFTAIFLPYAVAIQAGIVIMALSFCVMLGTGGLLIKKYRPARFYIIAWSILLGFSTIYILKVLAVLPVHFITMYSVQIGATFEIVLLSYGLGDRINQEKEEKRKAQEEALKIQIKMTNAFARFVPTEFLEFLNRPSIVEVELGDQIQKKMTVLFSDIRSFTSLSEKMTPRENFNFLNSYLKRIGPIIRTHNGFIDKYIGDSVMALFPGNPGDSLEASIQMQRQIIEYNSHRKSLDYQGISIGIGIHTGTLMLGTIGEENRMETTVISDAVNLASRMEGLTKVYGAEIVVSGELLDSIAEPHRYHYRLLDKVIVKGKNKPVSVFEIIDGASPENFELKMKTGIDYAHAVALYQDRQIKEANEIFQKIWSINGTDKAVLQYLKRCETLLKSGIPEEWDGIERLDNK